MDSILTLARTEGMLFKPDRHRHQPVADSFVEGTARRWRHGVWSRVVRRRATTRLPASSGRAARRRAAKMVILNADHPDIVDFINCKVEEEKKAWASSTLATTARSPVRRIRRCSSRTRTTACA